MGAQTVCRFKGKRDGVFEGGVVVGGWGSSLRWDGEHTLIYTGAPSGGGSAHYIGENQQNWDIQGGDPHHYGKP